MNNLRCEWEVGGLDVGGRLSGRRHGRRQQRRRGRLGRDEGAEVAAGVAQRDGGARAEGGLPQQGEVDACKWMEGKKNRGGL